MLALAGCGDQADSSAATPVAPTVTVADLAAVEEAVLAHRGEALLLNFWATWCGPCVAELPDLLEVAEELKPRGLRVLGVSYDLMLPRKEREATREVVRNFLVKRELDLPTLVYEAPDYETINERFDLPGHVPVTLAFDRSGAVVGRIDGEGTRAQFEALALKALGP